MKALSWLRSLVMALLFLPYLLVTSALCVFVSYAFGKRLDDIYVRLWGLWACRMFGVRPSVRGLENLPQGQGFVVLFNHTSFFDIFALSGSIPGLRFGAKIELFKIPFFGAAMRRVGTLPIDRSRKEDVFRVYEEASQRFREGARIALAPEGSRSLDGRLMPFKSGPFIFAIKAQVPLVPVVIHGASVILSKRSFLPNKTQWTRNIDLEVLPPLPTLNKKVEDRPELQRLAHEAMTQALLCRQKRT